MKKKILYIAHGSQDFCDDSIFCGLKDFVDKYEIDFTLSGCQFYESELATVEKRDSISIYNFKYDWMETSKVLGNYNPENKYDLIILGSIWNENQNKFLEVKRSLSENGKIVLIDGCDNGRSRDVNIHIPHDLLYRTNLLDSDWENGMVMPYGCPNDLLFRENNKPLDYVLNCQMGTTHPSRVETIDIVYETIKSLNLLDKSKITRYGDYKLPQLAGNHSHTSFNTWWDTLEKSKIIVIERGTGVETYRFWESMCTGNYVLCTPRSYYRENNIPLPINVIFWENTVDLSNKIRELIKISDDEVIKNRKNIKEFIKKHHLPKHRIQKILNKINF